MSLENVKKQLKSIIESMELSGRINPKIPIVSLCHVISSLVSEIEKIQPPLITALENTPQSPYIPAKRPREKETDPRKPGRYPPYNPNRTNAGDAQ